LLVAKWLKVSISKQDQTPKTKQTGKWQKQANSRQKNVKQKLQQRCNGSLYDITFIIILRAYWASNDDRANIWWPTTCALAPIQCSTQRKL